MKSEIIFVNDSIRLAAAKVSEDAYIVFEYQTSNELKEGDSIENLEPKYGVTDCRLGNGAISTVKILSSAMSLAKAKLVVAPWQTLDDFRQAEKAGEVA